MDVGYHNQDLEASIKRLHRGGSYKEQSTIIVCPTRGHITTKVLSNWFGLMKPMNQRCLGPVFFEGFEVGDAYEKAVQFILGSPDLKTWKYMLTIEEDNLPPADGLLKLLESIQDGYGAVGGLYWTKGIGGQPMIYGDPTTMPRNYIPQLPVPETVQECNGLGMGFTLFKIDMLQDTRFDKPLFKTVQEVVPGQGARMFTQDLWFYERARALGYRFACDTRVKVGHYDAAGDMVW